MKANRPPANVKILEVDKFIKDNRIMEVTSSLIHEPSSSAFHPEGLFSEEIFGEITSNARFYKFGYINLNTRVLHPRVYMNLMKLKRFYGEVISGKSYALFDQELGDFVPASAADDDADTGYEFFVSHLDKIKFNKNTSVSRNDKIDILNKYKNNLFVNKWLVLPAGIRDFRATDRTVGEVNNLYLTLLNVATAIPKSDANNPVYDTVRYAIQRKVNEISDYIYSLLEGKRGYMQGKYGKRAIALGTCNVISLVDMSASDPDSPQYTKSDETRYPLFQAAKMFQPLVVHALRSIFFDLVFDASATRISVIDPKTMGLVYRPFSDKDKNAFLSSDGINKYINLYENKDIRKDPVSLHMGKETYYLFGVYDTGDEIYIFRNLDDFKQEYQGVFDMKYVRPLTHIELMYMATYYATKDKHATVTRYPVLEMGSTYVTKVHLCSTDDARVVTGKFVYNPGTSIEFPEYPILKNPSIESVGLHVGFLQGLGADHDGDMVNSHGILTAEANAECSTYLNDIKSMIAPTGELYVGLNNSLALLTIFNLTSELNDDGSFVEVV